MASISNPSPAPDMSGMQLTSQKNQNGGYVGMGAEGQVALPAKVGFNGATPVGKATDMGAMSTNVTVTLLTEVAGLLNENRGKTNEIRNCLRNVGLMS